MYVSQTFDVEEDHALDLVNSGELVAYGYEISGSLLVLDVACRHVEVLSHQYLRYGLNGDHSRKVGLLEGLLRLLVKFRQSLYQLLPGSLKLRLGHCQLCLRLIYGIYSVECGGNG